MQHLTLIRHASASAGSFRGGDFDRPLDEDGLRDASEMGRNLAARGFDPALILSSAAARALATARAIAAAIGHASDRIQIEEDLYCASLEKLLGAIHELPMEVSHAALVAHNPGLSELAAWLRGEPAIALPTCAVVRIEIELDDWSLVSRGSGVQVEVMAPA
jgi:phosphohistidine phosphatase